MKKIIYILVLVLFSLSLSSCGKISDSDIVGVWDVVSVYNEEIIDGETKKYTETYLAGEYVYTFEDDGTFTINDEGEKTEGTWMKLGKLLTLVEGSGEGAAIVTVQSVTSESLVLDFSGNDLELEKEVMTLKRVE